MGRYAGSVCRFCRREQKKLFLKGSRCYTDKCAFERRGYPPGQHGWNRSKVTDFSVHLREKQKAKRIYGILERQFRKYFHMAARQKGVTGENLLVLLERRLDSTVYNLGFARTRSEARQLIQHSHFKVNGRRVNIPSFLVRPNDVVEVEGKSRKIPSILEAMEMKAQRGIPSWLEQNRDTFQGLVKGMPRREEIGLDIQDQLIVEFYSR